MKNIPEKIYIQPNIGGRELIKTWFPVKIDEESIEYIRTDSFIEKACEYFSTLDTIEVKDVDLEKEMIDYFDSMEVKDDENIYKSTFRLIAKHFFELGIQAQSDKEL